jgi:glycosyltransferase involved in cell wall biosynthesis
MNVLVASTQSPYVWGGAEALATALVEALRQGGHRAETLLVPFFPRPIEHVVASIQVARTIEIAESNFGAIDRLVTLLFPAYLIEHPAKTLWLVHQYRQFYELWDDPDLGFASTPFADQVRTAVARADRAYLPGHRTRFAISHTVARRLHDSTGLHAETLYPPLADASAFSGEEAADFFVCPGRLSVLKRQHLVLRALALTRAPVRITFFGNVDDDMSLERFSTLARELGVDRRAQYLEWISDADKRALYGRSIAVVFPPRLEDLGLVTLEAMYSSKAVITCTDSGGVLEFVADGDNGLVVEPEAAALAHALDRLWSDRALAARLGARGLDRVQAMNLSWPRTIDRLLA